MPADELLTPHFHLSQLTVNPHAAEAGVRFTPVGRQLENLRRLAMLLELVRGHLGGAAINVLRGFHGDRASAHIGLSEWPAAEGRAVEFIAPAFGTPRSICAHLVGCALPFERLVNADEWVRLEIPRFGQKPLQQLQTAVFEHGRHMRYLEGLV